MTTTSATTGTTTTTATADSTSLYGDYNAFLLLLTTQLQYQDPLDPMDTSEFTNQLVQYSQVEQQIKTNDYLEVLNGYSSSMETTKALGYVGLQIQSKNDSFYYLGTNTTLNYTLDSEASIVTINILDSDGNSVYTTTGECTEGMHAFTWDGIDADGNEATKGDLYTIKVNALDSSGKSISNETVVPGYVTGISTADDGTIYLMVNNTKVKLEDVKEAAL